jgi:malonyl-CoA/methylmalonyl-CoA synthetase
VSGSEGYLIVASINFPTLLREKMRDENAMFIRGDDGRNFTYGEYWNLAGQLANALAAHGVGVGDRVAVQVEKSVEALALFLACARMGAIFLPLNTAYTSSEMDYFIRDSEPKVLICTTEKFRFLSMLCKSVLTLGEKGEGTLMGRHSSAFEDADASWTDAVAILYTSGTTGKSKGAVLTHGNLASNALALVDAWAFTSRDVLIHALPIYHTHGLFTATNTVMLSGGCLLFRRKFDVNDVIALLPNATTMMGVPTFYTRLLAHAGLTRELVQHMRLFVSGSAPLLAETHRGFEEKTDHAILERYGMTETSMNTSNPYHGERRAGTVGMPLPGIEVRIADPVDGVGMIEVRGPNVFQGYWRNPEKTAAEFCSDGFFITGDLGAIDDRGYLTISGRGKDLVITGGFNVYPKEIEAELDALPGIDESAVIGIPHPDLGEEVVAVIVAQETAPEEAEIIAELQRRLARFKVPKRIVSVSELPRNAMGKVQKNLLRETYAGLFKP